MSKEQDPFLSAPFEPGECKDDSDSDTEIESVDNVPDEITEAEAKLMEGIFSQVALYIRQGNWQAARSLINQHDYGVNIFDSDGNAPLHVAIMNGHVDAVRDLLNFNANPNLMNEGGETPLTLTVIYSNNSQRTREILKLLLNIRRIDLNFPNEEGERAIHIVAYNGKVDLVRILIDRGASLNFLDHNDNNALHHATMNYSSPRTEETVEFLLSRGVNPDARNMQGNTALHNAADSGRTNLIKSLLRMMADENIQNGDGNTPLHIAAMNGNIEVVRLFVYYGAELTINNAGYSAADLASTDEIRDFLYQALIENLEMTGDNLIELIYGDDEYMDVKESADEVSVVITPITNTSDRSVVMGGQEEYNPFDIEIIGHGCI